MSTTAGPLPPPPAPLAPPPAPAGSGDRLLTDIFEGLGVIVLAAFCLETVTSAIAVEDVFGTGLPGEMKAVIVGAMVVGLALGIALAAGGGLRPRHPAPLRQDAPRRPFSLLAVTGYAAAWSALSVVLPFWVNEFVHVSADGEGLSQIWAAGVVSMPLGIVAAILLVASLRVVVGSEGRIAGERFVYAGMIAALAGIPGAVLCLMAVGMSAGM